MDCFPIRQVVPLKEMKLEELRRHDGNDTSVPMYLAIEGTLYDISKGHQFYGPGGGYLMPYMDCQPRSCDSKVEGLV